MIPSLLLVASAVVYARRELVDEADKYCYYTELGFNPDADPLPTAADIKKAYRTLSRTYHPDLAGTDEEKRQRYARIQTAYRVLGDVRLRKVFDLMGHDGVKKYEDEKNRPEQAGGFHPFFGRPASDRGPTSKLRLKVPLNKVYNGDSFTLKLNKNKICSRCKGSGAHSKEHFRACKKCKGEGFTMENVQFGPFVQQMKQPCGACGGKGKIPSKPCPLCNGRKVVKREVPIDLLLERGMPEGHEITFELEGEESPDQLPGDLVVTVHTAEHETFQRDGNNLKTRVKLNIVESLIGFRKAIKHLDDRVVILSHRGLTAPGTTRRVAGEGMPVHNVPSDRGDLFVTYDVEIPSELTPDQRRLVEASFPPRPPPGGRPFPTTVAPADDGKKR